MSIAEIRQFLAASDKLRFTAIDKRESYAWIAQSLQTLHYRRLAKSDKGVVLQYVRTMTNYSPAQTKRLVRTWVKHGRIVRKAYRRHRFARRYTRDDVVLLASVDMAHHTLSGPATRAILRREYDVFKHPEFERLSKLSVSHLYRLRQSMTYRNHAVVFRHTKGSGVRIGERHKPEPEGRPGFIRIDTVHQGDSANGTKGVYHINCVDEITQWELAACVETISERHLLPVLALLMDRYPFVLIEFHADNGSEFINKLVAELLNRLHVRLTKSRPRRHNDNALVETKNGSIIRKSMGYGYIPQTNAPRINAWYVFWFNNYLNFHRPCGYPSITVNANGKQKLRYKHEDYQTPYDKLKSLPDAVQCLKPNVTFAKLDKIAYAMSDTQYVLAMNKARALLEKELEQTNDKEASAISA